MFNVYYVSHRFSEMNKAKSLPKFKDLKRLYPFKTLSWQTSLKRVKVNISKSVFLF